MKSISAGGNRIAGIENEVVAELKNLSPRDQIAGTENEVVAELKNLSPTFGYEGERARIR